MGGFNWEIYNRNNYLLFDINLTETEMSTDVPEVAAVTTAAARTVVTVTTLVTVCVITMTVVLGKNVP